MSASPHPTPRGRAAWLGLSLFLFACGSAPTPEAQTAASDAPSAPAAQPANTAGGTDHVSDDGFELKISTSEVSAGSEGTALVELSSKAPYKCNADYPYRFKVSASEGLELASLDIKRDQATVEHDRVVLKIPFKAQQPGAHTLSGQFQFSICTSDRCRIEKRELSLQIDAK